MADEELLEANTCVVLQICFAEGTCIGRCKLIIQWSKYWSGRKVGRKWIITFWITGGRRLKGEYEIQTSVDMRKGGSRQRREAFVPVLPNSVEREHWWRRKRGRDSIAGDDETAGGSRNQCQGRIHKAVLLVIGCEKPSCDFASNDFRGVGGPLQVPDPYCLVSRARDDPSSIPGKRDCTNRTVVPLQNQPLPACCQIPHTHCVIS